MQGAAKRNGLRRYPENIGEVHEGIIGVIQVILILPSLDPLTHLNIGKAERILELLRGNVLAIAIVRQAIARDLVQFRASQRLTAIR